MQFTTAFHCKTKKAELNSAKSSYGVNGDILLLLRLFVGLLA